MFLWIVYYAYQKNNINKNNILTTNQNSRTQSDNNTNIQTWSQTWITVSWNDSFTQDLESPIDKIEILDLLNQNEDYSTNVKLLNKQLFTNQWKWNIYAIISWDSINIQTENGNKDYKIPEIPNLMIILDETARYIYINTKSSNNWYVLDTNNGNITSWANLIPLLAAGNSYVLTTKQDDKYIWRYMMSGTSLFWDKDIIIYNVFVDKNTKYILTSHSNQIYIYDLSGQNITTINQIPNTKVNWFVIQSNYIYIKSIDNDKQLSISKYDMNGKLIKKIVL